MLPKKLRLTKKVDYELVKKDGKRFNSRLLVLSVLESPNTSDFKFGIIVTPKVSSRAVDRNRVKRVVAHAVWELSNRLSKNKLYVLVAKREILKEKKDTVMTELEKLI